MAMDRLSVFSLLLFFAVSTLSLPLDGGENKEVTGVFIYPQPPQGIFNASAAKDACRSQNAALATKAQMERALQHGLETCKYGWIDEQIAVIPRRSANDKCGKGQIGLVVWKAALSRTFAAFCFLASDLKQTQTMTTDSVLSLTSKSTTTLPPQVHASTAVTPPFTTKMKPPPASIPSTSTPGLKLQAPVTSNSPPILASKPPTAARSSSNSPTSPIKPPTAATSSSTSPTSPIKPPTAATSSSTSPTASSTTAPPLLSPLLLTSLPARFSSSSSSLTVLSSTSLSPFTPPPSPPVTTLSPLITPPPPPPVTFLSPLITPPPPPPVIFLSPLITPPPPPPVTFLSPLITPPPPPPVTFLSPFTPSPPPPVTTLSPFTPSPSPPVSRNHPRGSTLQTVSSADTSMGGVHKALIVLAVILLLLTAAGAVWYFKLKKQVFTPWSRRQQKDDTETEMFKHNDSDLDLHGNQEVEEEADKTTSPLV